MKEELISFETAKLAKEKGFKGKSALKIYKDKELKLWYMTDGDGLELCDDEHPASTQSSLQTWLRKKHNLEVYVYPQFKKGKCAYDSFKQIGYSYCVVAPYGDSKTCKYLGFPLFELFPEELLDEDETLETIKRAREILFKTPEEALKLGLQEALKLIKNKD